MSCKLGGGRALVSTSRGDGRMGGRRGGGTDFPTLGPAPCTLHPPEAFLPRQRIQRLPEHLRPARRPGPAPFSPGSDLTRPPGDRRWDGEGSPLSVVSPLGPDCGQYKHLLSRGPW